MNRHRLARIVGGISILGLGLAGLSWGQGRLRYLAAETRPVVTPLPAVAGQPQRFVMTFDNGWTVNEVRRDGTVRETFYRVYPDTQSIRPSMDDEGGPGRDEDAAPPRDDAAPDEPLDRDRGGDDRDRDNGVDSGEDSGRDGGSDDQTGDVIESDRTLRRTK